MYEQPREEVTQDQIVKKPTAKERLTNPLFLLALSGFLYKTYTTVAEANGLPMIEEESWKVLVDLIAYGFIGAGIYSTFTKK